MNFSFAANGDPTGGATNSVSRGITWQVNDGNANSNIGASSLTVTHVAPTVTAGANAVYEIGQATPVVIDAALTTSDVDSGGNLSGATITITNALAGDTLNFATQNGIAGTLIGDTLALSGTASVADYQTALESITFSTTSANTATRTIQWEVNDASLTHNLSAVAASTIQVTNGPIVIASGNPTFTQGDAPVVHDPTLAVSDFAVANLTGATVKLESGVAGDTLNFTNQNNISGQYAFDAATGTGVLTLTGTDTVADYKTALESVSYGFSPANGDPTAGGTDTSRTIQWSVNDAALQSATASSNLTTAAAAAPTALLVTTSNGTVTFDQGGSSVQIDSGITVTDTAATDLTGATVTIATGSQSGDTLGFLASDLTGNTVKGTSITESYNSGVLTLSGSDTAANYQLAFSEVTFSSTASPLSTAPRTITFAATDGTLSGSGSDAVDIHDQPVVTAGATFNFTSGGPAVVLDNSLTVADLSSATLQTATVSIANFVDGDTLNFTDQSGIHGVYDSTHGILTLSGSSSVANYQKALDSVSYSYGFSAVNVDPTAGGANTQRTIDWAVNDGTLASATATSRLNILNAQPAVNAGGTATFLGGSLTATTLDGTLTVSDAPGATITGATVTIASGFANGVGGTDTLSFTDGVHTNTQTFTDGDTITATYDSTTGKLSLTGNASVNDYQTALQEVQYSFSPTNGDPTVAGTDTSRTVNWTVTDNRSTSATAASALTTVHEAPTVTASGVAAYGIGSGTAVALDNAALVGDVDSGGDLSSATVSIGAGFVSGDVLNFTRHGGIIGNYDTATGVLSFTGTDTLANYTATLDSITFQTSATTVGSRTISWVATDGSAINGISATATSTVDVLVGPAVTAGGTATFTGGGAAQKLDAGLSVRDPFSPTQASPTETIVGAIGGDTLNFTATAADGDITATVSGNQMMLTSAGGAATLAQWDAALDSITYSFSPADGDPTGGGTHTVRTIDWTINDGKTDSAIATSTLHTVHVPPTLTPSGTPVAYEIGTTAPVTLDSALTANDVDSAGDLNGATVTITNFAAGDTLSFTAIGNITGSYDAVHGTLTLQGGDTIANYRTALDSVSFATTSTVASSRNIAWTVSDLSSSAAASSSINVEVGPAVTTGGVVTTFTGGDPAQPLDPSVTVTEAAAFGSTISSATVTIVGAISGDTLNFTPDSATDGNITASVIGNQMTLTSSGSTATLAQWDAALDSVTYSFTPVNGDPTGGGANLSRTIDWQVNDGKADSAVATSTLDTLHAAPVVTPSATPATYELGSTAPVAVNGGLAVQDLDSGDVLTGATVAIANFASGDTLNFANTGKITGTYSSLTGVLTLTGNDSVADYQTALDSITFSTTNSSLTTRTIDWTVNDPVAPSAQVSSSVDVVGGPQLTASGNVTFNGGDAGAVLDTIASVTDASGTLTSATVTIGAGRVATDALSADTTGTHITATYLNGTLTLTGLDSTINYDKVLDSVTFSQSPTDGDPTNGIRTVSWTANDGVANSNTGITTVTTFHTGPTLTVEEPFSSSVYGIGGPAVVLEPTITIVDPDSGGNLSGATVTIAVGDPSDVLHFTNQNGITGNYITATRELTLSGTASIANYEAAIESITFSSQATTSEAETLLWTVSDGSAVNGTAGPVQNGFSIEKGAIVTAGATVSFSGGSTAPTVLDGTVSVSDPLSPTLASATVTIGGFVSGDTLSFTNNGSTEGNIGVQSNANGVLTLVSVGNSATITEWNAALDSVTYSFTANGDPTANGARPISTIDWQVNDGTSNSPVATSTLDLVHVAPVVTAGQSTTFIGGGSPVSLDPGHALTITDVDSGGDLSSASVSIGVGFVSGDTLSAVTGGTNITASYDAVNGILSLTGKDSIATYTSVLDAVTYSFNPTNADPTAALTDTVREIRWVVNDGAANSAAASSTLDVVHAPPTVTAGSTVTFTGGSASPVTIDGTLALTAPDSSGELTGATVTIASGLVNTANDQDVLSFNNGFNTEFFAGDNATITASYSSGQLTFHGTASVGDYQTALQQVQYFFHSSVIPGSPNIGDPTAGGSDTARSIVWQVNDGLALSPTTGIGVDAVSNIDTVHVAPSLTAGGTVTFVGGSTTPLVLDSAATVHDVDSDNLLTKVTVSISSGFIAGDTLSADTTGTAVTESYSNGVLTLTGPDTPIDFQHVLDSITYSFNPANGDPTGGGGDTTRTITFVASDGSTSHGSSAPQTVTLDTSHVAPVVTAGGTATFNQALSGPSLPAALDPTLNLVDVDSAGLLTGATVQISAPVSSPATR